MLTALRRLTGTFIARALFVLLIASFAVWGVGDIATGGFGRDDAIARVDGTAIPADLVDDAARRELQRLARSRGAGFEADARLRRGVTLDALDALIADRLVRDEAARLRLAVPDAALRSEVLATQGFRGGDGVFSRAIFDGFLRNNGLTEARFLEILRGDLLRQQLTDAVRAGADPPAPMARRLTAWLLETRAATIVTLPFADAPEPEPPTEAALLRFQENNPERFSTPELREATVAVLTAERLAREIAVTEAEIAEAYAARIAQYDRPERRELEQALLPDTAEAAATALAAIWGAGAEFAAIEALARAAGGEAVALGSLDRGLLPLPELAEAAFAAAANAVTAPIRSGFGWHVLRVVSVEPAERVTLAAARDELRATLAQERAADLAFERANAVEDALAGGATLAEVAERFNLGLARFRADAAGLDPLGRPVELPVIEAARAPLLGAVFATPMGTAPRLTQTEAGFVAIDLHGIAPPAPRPLAEVEAALRAAWTLDARRRSQEVQAASLLGVVRAGTPLGAAATAVGLGWQEVGAIGRERPPATIPPAMVAPIFALPVDDATMAATDDAFVVAQLREITPASDATVAAREAEIAGQVAQAMAQDVEALYLAALRGQAAVTINERRLEQLSRP